MGKNTKLVLGALLIIGAVFFASSVTLFFMRQEEVAKRVSAERQLEELKREKIRLSKELEDAVVVKKDLEIQLGNSQQKTGLLEKQLEEERRAKDTIFSQFENEKKESKRLVDEMMRIRDEKEEIALKLAAVKNECETIKTQLSSVQQAKEILEGKLKELMTKNEVELEKIVVKPELTPAPAPGETPPPAQVDESIANPTPSATKGEVMVVNNKFDFVVVNLGEVNGLVPGMNLKVYRGQQFLATLQVEKVHANMAAAKIPPEFKKVDIKEGDVVAIVE